MEDKAMTANLPFNREDPRTWRYFKPCIIAHDVGRSRDRSTAVVGGLLDDVPSLIGMTEFEELPQGLYGSHRASALAEVDRRHYNNALIVADLSNDPTYAEVLYDTFGRRVIGVHITRNGDGTDCERRPVRAGSILVYTIGRTHLIELYHTLLHDNLVRIADGPMARRAYQQLAALDLQLRETGAVYDCPSGQHDDLGISCAMLAWAAQHKHLSDWVRDAQPRRRVQQLQIGDKAWT
jgi:hypothetical protein